MISKILGITFGIVLCCLTVIIYWRLTKTLSDSTRTSHDFVIGQKWLFQGRIVDPKPEFIVIDIETHAGKEFVHIGIAGIRLRAPLGMNGDILPHVPVTKEALEKSGIVFMGTGSISEDSKKLLLEWKNARGGYFIHPLCEVLDIMQEGLDKALLSDKK